MPTPEPITVDIGLERADWQSPSHSLQTPVTVSTHGAGVGQSLGNAQGAQGNPETREKMLEAKLPKIH